MAKISVDLTDVPEDETPARLKALADPLPSVSRARSGALRDAPRVQMAFTNVPLPVKQAFDAEARRRGIGKKELLYDCLRRGGLDIPDQAEIDGRRR